MGNKGNTGFLGDEGYHVFNTKTNKPMKAEHLRYVPPWINLAISYRIHKEKAKTNNLWTFIKAFIKLNYEHTSRRTRSS